MRQISPSLPAFAPYGVGDEAPASWESFHEESKLRGVDADALDLGTRDRILGAAIDRFRSPRGAPSHELSRRVRSFSNGLRVALPCERSRVGGRPFLSVVEARASAREFAARPIALDALATVLALTWGPTRGRVVGEGDVPRRGVPSPGALYCLEPYVMVHRVAGLEAGIYHYDGASAELARLEPPVESAMPVWMPGPGPTGDPAAHIVLCAVIGRLTWKYGERGYRLALLEAGHAGQQLCLASEAAGLAACPLQSFVDDRLASMVGADGQNEVPLHAVALGAKEEDGGELRRAPGGELRPEPGGLDPAGAPLRSSVAQVGREPAPWQEIDRDLRLAFEALAQGLPSEARRRLLLLSSIAEAPDRTCLDYLKLTADSSARVRVRGKVLCAHPRDWATSRGEALAVRAAAALEDVARALRIAEHPCVFVDARRTVQNPSTGFAGRPVQRRVRISEDPDDEVLFHEMTHALVAPPNRLLAEGLAGLLSCPDGAIDEVEGDLAHEMETRDAAAHGTDPESTLLRMLTTVWRVEGEGASTRVEDVWLVAGLGGSFVRFLDGRLGRESLVAAFLELSGLPRDHVAADQEAVFRRHTAFSFREAVDAWACRLRSRGCGAGA